MTRSAAEHRARVWKICRDSRLKPAERGLAVWNYVINEELLAGTQFLRADPGGQLYVVLGTTNEVIRIPAAGRGGERWHAYFNEFYGFVERDPISQFCHDSLRHYIVSYGSKIELRRFAAFSHTTQTAYLSAYNGQMFKIEGSEQISTVPIGEDSLFFVDDDNGVHVTPDIGPHGVLIDRLSSLNFSPGGLSGITPEQQKMALIVWAFALALPDMMPTKPILLVEGVMGSGKTSCVTFLQLVLTGAEKSIVLQRNKEDDFGIVLLRSPIALFDNVDSYIDWVPDAIAAYATGAGWDKRKLFTDDEHMVIRPHSFVAVASRNPASFRRDDVADRCIVLRLERRKDFVSMKSLKAAILADRPRLLGEYIWYLGRIIDELRADATAELDAQPEVHRMADYAALARIVGRVVGWAPEAVDELMTALQGERDAFINEDDPLVDLLTRWVEHRYRDKRSNIGRTITLFDLHAELETLAQASQMAWKDSARVLVQKLRSTHIEREFRVEQINTRGHRAYRIWRHSDPRLELVAEANLIATTDD